MWESDIQDIQQNLAGYLGISESDVVYNPGISKYWGVDTAEFYTPSGVYNVIDGYTVDDAMHTWVDSTIDNDGLDGFSLDFQDWMIAAKVFNENRLHAFYSDWCYDDANSLYGERSYEGYANLLIEYCVNCDLISAFDIVDGEYLGDENLIELYADYEYDQELVGYSSYADWYVHMFGFDALSDWVRVDNDIADLDAVVDEFISRDGYKALAPIDGIAHDLGDYYAFKVDGEDLRNTLSSST